ncbi:hypothetical protein ACFL0H_02360 [Thermodesulfobacteriota bacterium]
MNKEKLIDILKGILNADVDLNFLLQLNESEIKTLVASVRESVDRTGE